VFGVFIDGSGKNPKLGNDPTAASGNCLPGAFVPGIGGELVFSTKPSDMPVRSHGTFCAGMAGARVHNGHGGCGAAPGSELLLVATLGVNSQRMLARAIAYAVDPSTECRSNSPLQGADVISCSLGMKGRAFPLGSELEDAIAFAVTRGRGGLGTPIFWAADNSNVSTTIDEVVSHPNTIVVARSTPHDTHDASAFGTALDFLAPGANVYSTYPDNRYGTGRANSYATPCAAGVAALMLSVNPVLRWHEVRQILRDTCDKVGGASYDAWGHNEHYGYGRINAERAVNKAAALAEKN
jgi:thermitase